MLLQAGSADALEDRFLIQAAYVSGGPEAAVAVAAKPKEFWSQRPPGKEQLFLKKIHSVLVLPADEDDDPGTQSMYTLD